MINISVFDYATCIMSILISLKISIRFIKIVFKHITTKKFTKKFDEVKFLEMVRLQTIHGQSVISHKIGLRNIQQ